MRAIPKTATFHQSPAPTGKNRAMKQPSKATLRLLAIFGGVLALTVLAGEEIVLVIIIVQPSVFVGNCIATGRQNAAVAFGRGRGGNSRCNLWYATDRYISRRLH